MQPGHIRVFDGLRVTTEHIDHFQGSLHSAINDVRRILGTGRVHRGFSVTHGTGRQIVVQPGLAFDHADNRIVNDDPITLDVPPLTGTGGAFVCISYAQVEDGVVDGQATLVYDSCTVEIRPHPPSPAENVLTIAKLVPPTDGATNSFEIIGESPLLSSIVPDAPTMTSVLPEPAATKPAVRLHQDVLRLSADDASRGALSVLRGAMKRFAESNLGPAPSATLASATIPVGFTVAAVSCHAALDATLRGLSPEAKVALRGLSHGDATLDAADVAQQCASQADVVECGDAQPYAWRGRVGVSQSCIAALPLAIENAGHDAALPIPAEVLRGLILGVRLGAPTEEGLSLECTLVWDGAVSDDVLAYLNEQSPTLDWNVAIAWKAQGTAPAAARASPG